MTFYNFLYYSHQSTFPTTAVYSKLAASCSKSHFLSIYLLYVLSTHIGSLLLKPVPSAMPYADWFHHCDFTCHGSASDAQVSSHNIYAGN